MCQMVNFVTLVGTSNSCSYAFFLQNKDTVNKFCILSVINQMQDEAFNVSDNFRSISTLKNNKKIYITCLQYSYSVSLCFPYDINYLPNGCEANTITFVLPSNNGLSVNSIMEALESKLGFNRSYSKINNFSLMQSLNISSLTDDSLQNLSNKMPEMKHMSTFSINNTIMKIRSLPPTFWSSMEVKLFSTIGTCIMVIIILLLIISLYGKYFQNKKGCVHKYTGLHSPYPTAPISI